MKEKKINQWALERYILDELPSEKIMEIKNRLHEDSNLKKEIEKLKKSNQNILNQYSSDIIIPKILSRYEKENSRSENKKGIRPILFKRLLYASPVLASALVLLFIILHYRGNIGSSRQNIFTEDTRIKGMSSIGLTTTHLMIHRRNNDIIELLENGDKAKAGNLLQIAYVATRESYGVILSIDGNGMVTLHYPDSKNEATVLEQNRKVLIGNAYELDDAPEFERFFFITSKSEINVDEILERAETLAKKLEKAKREYLELPESFNQSSILLVKGE